MILLFFYISMNWSFESWFFYENKFHKVCKHLQRLWWITSHRIEHFFLWSKDFAGTMIDLHRPSCKGNSNSRAIMLQSLETKTLTNDKQEQLKKQPIPSLIFGCNSLSISTRENMICCLYLVKSSDYIFIPRWNVIITLHCIIFLHYPKGRAFLCQQYLFPL